MKFFKQADNDQTMIRKRVMEIKDPQVREQANQIAEGLLIPFDQEMTLVYQELERRLFQNQQSRVSSYQIITSIAPRNQINEMHTMLHPIRPSDLNEHRIDLNELQKQLRQNSTYDLYSVYVDDSYEHLNEMLQLHPYFLATITTQYGTYQGKVRLEPDHSYEPILGELYECFLLNDIEWKTINIPFLHKILKVVLIQADIPEDEEIINIQIDYQQYEQYLRFDYVPLWNISCKKVTASVYPKLCRNQVHYEHTIMGDKLQEPCEYMVKGDCQIWRTFRRKVEAELQDQEAQQENQEAHQEAYQENQEAYQKNQKAALQNQEAEDLVIECDARKPVEFQLFEFAKIDKKFCSDLILMENENESFPKNIRTEAEAIRFAASLSVHKYLKLRSVTTKQPEGFREDTIYDMDDFLPEGIRRRDQQPKLYLECESMNLPETLRQDILSYLIARFQWIYPEYHCVGRIKISRSEDEKDEG